MSRPYFAPSTAGHRDGADRLRQGKDRDTGSTLFTATYDGDGRRVSKWDAWTGQHDYSWGPGGPLHDSNGNTTSTPGFAQRNTAGDLFFHNDWLGSTRWMSEASNGNSFPYYRLYDSQGQKLVAIGALAHVSESGWGGEWGYQSEYQDATQPGLGLVYMQQRYYDPALGRFLSPDPLGFADGLNPYSYCGNDPINHVDPTGGFTQLLFGALNLTALYHDSQTLRAHLDCGAPWWQIAVDVGMVATDAASLVLGVPPVARGALALAQGAIGAQRAARLAVAAARWHGAYSTFNAGRAGISYASGQSGQPGRWRVGDDPYTPTRQGEPSWSTVTRRVWKNEAARYGAERRYGRANLERMRKGQPPQRPNRNSPTGKESMEQSHEPIPARQGGRKVVPRYPTDHAAVDKYRRPGY